MVFNAVLWQKMLGKEILILLLFHQQAAVKGGITVSAVFNYQVSPELSTKFCYKNYRISVRNCAGIYHQWRNNKILLDVWYSTRSVRWCKKWGVPYVSFKIYVVLHMCSPLYCVQQLS